MRIDFLLFIFACFAAPGLVSGQSNPKDSLQPIPPPKIFESEQSITIAGKKLGYRAIAAELPMINTSGDTIAYMWSISYLASNPNIPFKRPVTFIFNGGPGSASVWLQMGLLGPKIVQVPGKAEADDGAPPYPIVDNPHNLLDITDLVFIDPVGTGYSRVVGKGKEEDFWGLREDARSISQFIRSWVTKYKRWNAPKYLAGESFGTTRAAGVAYELMGGGQDMALNGIVMISQALDYAGSTSEHDNITSYFTYLPAMAATAWYHKKSGQNLSLESFVDQARQFAYDEYAPALYKGNWLRSEDRARIIERLHYFTGLDTAYIRQSNLRILVPRFQKELLRKEGLTIGRLDGRYKSLEADLVAEQPTIGDPASYSISSAYTASLYQYLADNLKVNMDRPYLTGNSSIYPKWNWKPVPKSSGWEPSYVNTARLLGDAMRKNTGLRILVLSGYYDLITPFFDAEYTFTRNGIITERVDFKYYEGGHMMYTHAEDFPKVCQDIRDFLTKENKK